MNCKDGRIAVSWSKREDDVNFLWGAGKNMSTSARLLYYHFTKVDYNLKNEKIPSLLEELEKRGFDLKTIKFTIDKKQDGTK